MSFVKSISAADGSKYLMIQHAPSLEDIVTLENIVRSRYPRNLRQVSASDKKMIKVHQLTVELFRGPEPLEQFLDRLHFRMRLYPTGRFRHIYYQAAGTVWKVIKSDVEQALSA